MTTIKQAESNWSCLAHGTSFLFPQWDYHSETNRESLVLYRSRDQFPISPVRWPNWIKQRAIGSMSLTEPVSYFSSEMTTMKQTESHWSCVAYGTSFLFLQWDDHNEKKKNKKNKTKKQRAIGPVSVTGPVSYFSSEMTTIKQTEIHWSCVAHGTSFLFPKRDYHNETNREPLVLYRSRDQFPFFPSEMNTMKQT